MPHNAGPTRRNAMLAVLAASAAAPVASSAAETIAIPTGGVHDFDYYFGDWAVVNRRMKVRWTKTPEWEVFPGTVNCRSYLGGAANVSEAKYPTQGFSGLTLRTFDKDTLRWSIYWVSSRGGDIASPSLGGFNGNVGLFYGDDTDDGHPIKVRIRRTKRPPDHELWEQAFSRDGGLTWETNWAADFTRVRRRA